MLNVGCIECVAEANIYRSIPQASGMIALTFDDGPHPRYTKQILDILKKEGIKATFFVIGENIGYYDEGCIRGNIGIQIKRLG